MDRSLIKYLNWNFNIYLSGRSLQPRSRQPNGLPNQGAALHADQGRLRCGRGRCPGDQQAERRPVYGERRKCVLIVSAVLRHRAAQRPALRTVAAGDQTESGVARSGAYDIRGTKHHRAHGAAHTDSHAEPHSVPAGSGNLHLKQQLRPNINLMLKYHSRYCWYTRHLKGVFHECLISRQTTCARMTAWTELGKIFELKNNTI